MCRRRTDGLMIPVVAVEMDPDLARSGIVSYPENFMAEGSLVITRDRWERQREMTRARLLAHLGIFRQIYARNCEVRRIDKPTASHFLERCHSYGDATCKFRYGMFLKRSTGAHNTRFLAPGTLVAVSTFSGARRWQKEDKVVASYEWTRYASLPDVRICGGMGKMLQFFIDELAPDDVMSYADLEWSQGTVYESLGFVSEGCRGPVDFEIDCSDWTRRPLTSRKTCQVPETGEIKNQESEKISYRSPGSIKYRLKLTEY